LLDVFQLPTVDTIVTRLRLKQLRLLIALDEHGSLHRAADEMTLTQPGATKALREIEATFGATFFTRSPQGIQPNELGRCVIPRPTRRRYSGLSRSCVMTSSRHPCGNAMWRGQFSARPIIAIGPIR
jgi:hypothetical protein